MCLCHLVSATYTGHRLQQLHYYSDALTSMDRWKLRFALLLLLTFYANSKGTGQHIAKTIGSKPDITPVCVNETLNNIVFVVCKVRTERNPGEECRLRYRSGMDFINKCDSRFTLRTENQTVVLHLTSLTPEDSGNYTCECSRAEGINILHLNITVEEDEDGSSPTGLPLVHVLSGVFVLLFMIIIIRVIHTMTHHRRRLEPLASQPNSEPQNIEPYSTFIQRENELYSTTAMHSYPNTNNSNVFTQDDSYLRVYL